MALLELYTLSNYALFDNQNSQQSTPPTSLDRFCSDDFSEQEKVR